MWSRYCPMAAKGICLFFLSKKTEKQRQKTWGASKRETQLMKRPKNADTVQKTPQVELKGSWAQILEPSHIKILEKNIFTQYLLLCRWFGGKSRHIRSVKVKEVIRAKKKESAFTMLILSVRYASGDREDYLLPLAYTADPEKVRDYFHSVICGINVNGKNGFLYDAVYDIGFQRFLLKLIVNNEKIKTAKGELAGMLNRDFNPPRRGKGLELPSHVLKAEQSNTSIIYKNVYFLKLLRKLGSGISPEREMTSYLTRLKRFHNVPAFAGSIEYRPFNSDPIDLCLLQSYVPNQGDAWKYMLEHVRSYFGSVLLNGSSADKLIDAPCFDLVRLLGKRTGQLHLGLASDDKDPNFKPEPFSMPYQRALYRAMVRQARYVMRLLRESLPKLPTRIRGEAVSILAMEKEIFSRFALILKKKFSVKKIRIHGDYHLGQVLFTGKDFVIMDFEGEPAAPMNERRLKRSALRDVAGMMRSFHYAAYGALFLDRSMREADVLNLDSAADLWSSTVADVFARAYFKAAGKADFLPKDQKDLNILLEIYLLNKAIYELGYELNNRPGWVIIPLRGIKRILEDPEKK